MKRRRGDGTLFDEVVESTLYVDHSADGYAIARLDKQDCSAILKHNQEMVDAGGSRSMRFGKAELEIPRVELHKLKRRYPDLASPDRETKIRAWKRYMASPESKPWRISVGKYH